MRICNIIILLTWWTCTQTVAGQDNPNSTLSKYHQILYDWMKDTAKARLQIDSSDTTPLDQILDWQEIARRTFPENWVNISSSWQKRYTRAIRRKIMKKTAADLPILRTRLSEKNVRWEEAVVKNGKAKTDWQILREGDLEKVNLRLILSDGVWKIYDVRTAFFRLIRDLLGGFDDLISNGYSHEYVEAQILESDSFIIDDFSANESGDYPRLWGWRKKDDDLMRSGQRLYVIQKENDNAYLASETTSGSVALVKPFSYNIREFPYLSWRWRVREFPRIPANTASQAHAAEIVVLFYQNWIGMPITLHYIWDSNSSPCTTLRQSGMFKDTFYKVIRTDSKASDEWFYESVNPFEDYKRIFGEEPPEQIIGIFLLTESDNTNSRADFDDFIVRKTVSNPSCAQ